MRHSINPFDYFYNSVNSYKNSFYEIFSNDPDDIVEDIIKIGAFTTLNYLIIYVHPLPTTAKITINLVGYIPINKIADRVGDFIDGDVEVINKESTLHKKIAHNVGGLVGDVAEDVCKLLFLAKYYLVGTGLRVAEQNLPFPLNIIAKGASGAYALTEFLSDYHHWNKLADSIGNWAEDQLLELLGSLDNNDSTEEL